MDQRQRKNNVVHKITEIEIIFFLETLKDQREPT